MEMELSKIELKENDILIIKGIDFDFDSEHILKTLNDRGFNNIVLVIPEGSSIETIDRQELINIARKIEQKIEFERYCNVGEGKKDETA